MFFPTAVSAHWFSRDEAVVNNKLRVHRARRDANKLAAQEFLHEEALQADPGWQCFVHSLR
jgi:hypothetical protein